MCHVVLQVRLSQKGNPVLSCIRNVQWEMVSDLIPDYVVGSSTCALFLSVKYHLLHPKYILGRMNGIGNNYRLRVVVCLGNVTVTLCARKQLSMLIFCYL